MSRSSLFERLLGRSGAKAAVVAFRPPPLGELSPGDSVTRSGHDLIGRVASWARPLAVAGALAATLGATLGLGANAAHAGAVRTDAAFNANTLPRNDDESTGLVPIGFPVNFFGTTYTSLYVNNNGNVTFDQPLGEYTPFSLTSTNRVIIAPFFADVDTSGSGSQPVRYGFGQGTVDGRRAFGANYINVGYFSSHFDKLNSFQVVLIDRSDVGAGNFDIELNYDKVQFETGDFSNGTNGLGGNSARAGFSNGSGNAGTSFEISGSAVNGAFLDSNTSRGLIYNSINSNVRGRYLFAVRNGQITRTLSISNVSVTEGNSGTTNANFAVTLSPASDQTVTVNFATANGSATAGNDYTATAGTLTFTPGQNTRTISVPVRGDTTIEPDETFLVNLTSPSGAVLGTSQGTGTIVNDDFNAPPTVAPFTVSTNEDTTFTFATTSFDGAFSDPNGDTLQSVRIVTLPANGSLRLGGTAVVANQVIPRNQLNTLTFAPALNFNGATSFLYNASDGGQFAANNATVNITVVPVNDAPTISDIPNQIINQDTSTGALPFVIGDVETAPAQLTLSATSSNPALAPVAGIVFGGAGANRTVTVTPVAGATGASTITVTVSDGTASASDSFVLTVNRVNAAPTLAPANFNGTVGVPFSQQLNGQDANGDTLTYSVTGGALPGGLSLSAGGLIAGTPATAGTFNATVTVSDGQATASALIKIGIAPAAPGLNLPPILDNQTLSASVNREFSTPLSARDPNGDPLTFTLAAGSSLPPGVTLSSSGILSGTPTQSGQFRFTILANDGRGGVGGGNFIFNVVSAADGQGPVITRVSVPTPVTRDQLAALTLSGTVRDVAGAGVTPSGVRRVLFQLRRVSDGFSYNGSAFTPDARLGYYVVPVSAASADPGATRTYSRALSFLPPTSVLTPGTYSLLILAQDNAGNYSVTVVFVEIVAPVAPGSASAARSFAPATAPSAGSS